MFEKQFDLAGLIGELETVLDPADFPAAVETFAEYLKNTAMAYREASSTAERRRELAFMVHVTAKLNEHLVSRLVEETPK